MLNLLKKFMFSYYPTCFRAQRNNENVFLNLLKEMLSFVTQYIFYVIFLFAYKKN